MVELSTTQQLSKLLIDWTKRLEEALRNVENQHRRRSNRKPYPEGQIIWLPLGPNAELQLLTLKVWTMRYCVTPEFLLDFLITTYRKFRKYNPDRDRDLKLGLPASLILGVSARQRVEEAVLKAFPNRENRKQLSLPELPKRAYKPSDDPEADMEDYLIRIRRRRIQYENTLRQRQNERLTSKRNYRRP